MKATLPPTPSGPFARLLAVVAGLTLLIAGFLFSLAVIAMLAIAGLVVWGYLWWKTRTLRQAMKNHRSGGNIIDGESFAVDDSEANEIVEAGEDRSRRG